VKWPLAPHDAPMKHGRTWLLAIALVSVTGCSSSGKGPLLASSSGQAAYAIHYDDELTSATKSVSEAQTREKSLSAGFGAYVDQLKKPDWSKVADIVDDSDEAGKSADFAEAANDAIAIKSFWDSDKNELGARVNGATQQKLKEAGCSADVGGQISWAMGEAINKQLQKRLRSKNEAFVIIDRYRPSLGPQNVVTLEKLADDVSEASYEVHVLMILQRERLKRLADDKGGVKKTLDRYIQEETDFQAEPGRTDAEKKASTDRVTAANKSKADVDTASAQAEATAKDLDKAIDAATKDYEDALKSLKTKIAEKKKAEPTKEPGKS
jgi:hypothetical protein